MPASPPKTTLILHNIPEKCLLGIDLHFFTSTAESNGIKLIPDGIHILHWSPPAPGMTGTGNDTPSSSRLTSIDDEDGNDNALLNLQLKSERQAAKDAENIVLSNMNLRMAVFFEACDSKILCMTWDDEAEEFVTSEREVDEFALLRLYPHLLPYPQSSPEFADLTSQLNPELLSTYLPLSYRKGVPVSSITASSTDSLLLSQAISKASSSSKSSMLSDDTDSFRFLNFDLKRQRTWREGATGRELTTAALDRSWFLGDLISRERNGDYNAVLAELQLSFILLVLLANYSASEQWRRIVELLCSSKSAVSSRPEFYRKFLTILYAQFECIPEVYFTDLLGFNFVKGQLRELRKTLIYPFNGYFGPEPTSSESEITAMTADKEAMLHQIEDIGNLLEEKFGLNMDFSGTARSRRRKETILGGLSGTSSNGFEKMHHYGSDDDDGPSGFGAADDSDDAEEERGEYAPVVVDL
ncbi:A1 cistron-splicing factor [Lipomyces orientalis]|uniref:A1 cistron-splicing factor n=1 Tax=Lipomyces orientalis TaxID=1233043 RepID=A0ACC3TT83_9ASCO